MGDWQVIHKNGGYGLVDYGGHGLVDYIHSASVIKLDCTNLVLFSGKK